MRQGTASEEIKEVWVCFTIYKGKLILCELFDGVRFHGCKDKREAANVISSWADLILFQVKHVFYSAPFDANIITCLPGQTRKSVFCKTIQSNAVKLSFVRKIDFEVESIFAAS